MIHNIDTQTYTDTVNTYGRDMTYKQNCNCKHKSSIHEGHDGLKIIVLCSIVLLANAAQFYEHNLHFIQHQSYNPFSVPILYPVLGVSGALALKDTIQE